MNEYVLLEMLNHYVKRTFVVFLYGDSIFIRILFPVGASLYNYNTMGFTLQQAIKTANKFLLKYV